MPLDIFPTLWQEIEKLHEQKQIASTQWVYDEIGKGKKNDTTRVWAERLPDTWWLRSNEETVQLCYANMVNKLYETPGSFTEFFQPNSRTDKVADFMRAADSWLVAFCQQGGRCLVTEERLNRNTRKKLLIPVVCEYFSVDYCDMLQMLRSLKVQV